MAAKKSPSRRKYGKAANKSVKRAMHKGFQMDWRTLGEYQQSLGDVLWETQDHMEGVNSFVEKREPRFRGA